MSDDFLASACSFLLVVVVVCCYSFKARSDARPNQRPPAPLPRRPVRHARCCPPLFRQARADARLAAAQDYEFFGLPDIIDKMSREQRSLYIINQNALIIVVISSVVGAIVVSCVIFAVQFVVVGRRLRTESLRRKARRLRRKVDDDEVQVEERMGRSSIAFECSRLRPERGGVRLIARDCA